MIGRGAPMTLQQLKYAVGVARWGSFNEAATRLFISQPSLSAAVRELEDEMGVRIFNRTSRGVTVTGEGTEFLGYARQVIEQAELLESRWAGTKPRRRLFSVSAQHYAFAVNAFVDTVRELAVDEYDCTLRETRTSEILDDVATFRSELGILYLSDFNRKVLERIFHERDLRFTPLFEAEPHVFLCADHELAGRDSVTLNDLEPWPCLSFEQGEHNSFHYSEELLSTAPHRKNIRVSDRATLFNLLIGLGGYTVSTGVLPGDLNGDRIIAVPLVTEESMTVGYIVRADTGLGPVGERYLRHLETWRPKREGS